MTREMYYKLTQPFREPKRARSLHIANKILTAILFVAYPILLIRIYFCQSEYLLGSILVPLDGFIGVTVFRYLVNRRRPYETFGCMCREIVEKFGKPMMGEGFFLFHPQQKPLLLLLSLI